MLSLSTTAATSNQILLADGRLFWQGWLMLLAVVVVVIVVVFVVVPRLGLLEYT